jgi:hypothetical protein
MGLRNDSQNRQYIKIVVDEKTGIPNFFVSKDKVLSNPSTTLTGFLKQVTPGSYEWEGKTVETIKFLFDDDTDQSVQLQLETNFSFLSRSILNSLAGCAGIGHVMIRLYLSKENDKGKRFPQAYVEVDGSKSAWKYQVSDYPKPESITNKKGEVVSFDDTETNAFFKNVINIDINTKIKSEFEAASKTENTAERKQEPVTYNEEIKDDLPF